MASTTKENYEDMRRTALSPRLKGRENAKDTLCRNVTIYGHCRYEDKGCAFNHDPVKTNGPTTHTESSLKKHLNVDSPSFTPSGLSANGGPIGKKTAAISPKAANAAPFLPKGASSRASAATPPVRQEAATPDWAVPDVQEFIPQGFDPSHLTSSNGAIAPGNSFDPFVASNSALAASGNLGHQVQPNPYSQDTTSVGGAAFYQGQGSYQQPLQYHLYAPLGPHNPNLMAYQRSVHDFFIPNDLREYMQKRTAASLQTLPNSQLPTQIDHFHSLVPLDTTHQKNAAIFGYPSWVYKAQSSKDGNYYVLRRLEGFRLTNEKAIRSAHNWKRVSCGNIITIHDAFTTRMFQDSSLIFVTDYHPLSKTLAELHFSTNTRFQARHNVSHVPENILWGYVVQMTSALKAIHGSGLAARIIDPSKILLTAKNHIRLNACAIMDVVQHETQVPLVDLQRNDLAQFGKLLLTLGVNNPNAMHNAQKAMEQFGRSYGVQLRESVAWLLSPSQPDQPRTIDLLANHISSHIITAFDSTLHLNDQLNLELNRELENGRIVRLMTKLNFINERPEYNHEAQWSENGERYFLKLFRDFAFHQVDAQDNAVVDLGHVLTCLAKLDAGSDERVMLMSRDEGQVFFVSYKELKKAVESSFQDLAKPGRRH